MTNERSLVERLREHADFAIDPDLVREAADAIEKLTRQRDTYRQACEGKQDIIDRLLLQFCPGELPVERRAELKAKPALKRADLAKSRLETKRASSPAEPSSEP